jgi:hypothetical protein
MLAWVAVAVLAAHDLEDEPSRGRVGLSLSGGAAFSSAASAELSGEIEALYLPAKYFRVGVALGGLWARDAVGGGRALIVLEGVLPQWWGEWFFGIGGGAAYTNWSTDWRADGAGRVRVGADLVLFRPLFVGVSISYNVLAPQWLHSGTIDLRVGAAF